LGLPPPPPQAVSSPAAVARTASDPTARRDPLDRAEGEAPRDRLWMCMCALPPRKVNYVTPSRIHRTPQALTDPEACASRFRGEVQVGGLVPPSRAQAASRRDVRLVTRCGGSRRRRSGRARAEGR